MSVAVISRLLRKVSRVREVGVILGFGAAVLIFSARSSEFMTGANWRNIGGSAAILMAVAMGELVVVLSRNIDLSVGSVMLLCAFAGIDLVHDHPHVSVLAVAAICVGTGLACGLINGLLVTMLRIPSIIITLAGLSIYRGIMARGVGGSTLIGSGPALNYSAKNLLGIPVLTIVATLAALLVGGFLRWSNSGRDLYAIGSNPTAAEYVGIPVRRRTIAAFAIAGLLVGLGGFFFASTFASVAPDSASGYEFTAISAVVIGGANLFGGAGSVLGTTLGAFFLITIESGFTILHVSDFWKQAFEGFSILAFITIDALIRRRARNVARRKTSAKGRAAVAGA